MEQRKNTHTFVSESGIRTVLTLDFPVFGDEIPDVIRSFYDGVLEKMKLGIEKDLPFGNENENGTARRSVLVCGNLTRADPDCFSLYMDIRCYIAQTLVYLKRVAQTFEKRKGVGKKQKETWLMMREPKKDAKTKEKLRKEKMTSPSGFYLIPNGIVYFENRFKEGDGVGLRRSEEARLIKENHIFYDKTSL